MHAADVHSTFSQLAPAAHDTSHAHELPHATPRHELWPVHITLQRPVPHAIS